MISKFLIVYHNPMIVTADNRFLRFLTGMLFFFLGHHSLNGQVSNPQGKLENIGHELIWTQTLKGKHFNEFWNYQFYLNDGLTVHIVFSAVDFGGLKPPVTGVKVSVFNLDENIYQLTREYSMDKLLQDRGNHLFRPNPERELYFKGKLPDEHMIRIGTSKDGNLYDIMLELNNIADGFRLGDGKYNVEGEEIGIITHIPYAEVTGYVAVNEVKKEVTGTAYMDHTYQNQTTSRLMDSGYRFVYHDDAKNWDLVYFMLPDNSNDGKTIGYRVVNDNGNTEHFGVNKILQRVDSNTFDRNFARIIEVDIGNGRSVRLLRTENHEKFSVFDELGWVARKAARTFLGGEVIDFRGEAAIMERGHKPKNGFYNFFLVD